MKIQRKLLTEKQISDFCANRKKESVGSACYNCPLKLRLSSSTYCLKEIPELQKLILDFLCGEVEFD